MTSRFTICLAILLGLYCLEGSAEQALHPSFLPEKLEDPKGKKLDSSLLAGKYIGLYFSASWCGPCRAFTPKLKQFRNEHRDGFEVILVNFDRTTTAKRKYVRDSGMEWPSVIGARRKTSRELAETYRVETYPALIILDPQGNVVTDEGVEAILNRPESVSGEWKEIQTPNA